jgi:hypothetical protein
MKIDKVTITGADDSVNPSDIYDISKKYPYVEWAILLSASQMGRKRFPSKKWMTELTAFSSDMNVAGHLCGKWMRNLMTSGNIDFLSIIPKELWDDFKRIQLNFHGEKFEFSWDCIEKLRHFTWRERKQFILQMDNVNNEMLNQLLNAGVLTFGLFDTSHGTGELPTEWPSVVPGIIKDAYRGYAGGLSCDNLESELEKLNSVLSKDQAIWIDVETKIRSNNDLQFDLDKVEKFLDIAKKWVE